MNLVPAIEGADKYSDAFLESAGKCAVDRNWQDGERKFIRVEGEVPKEETLKPGESRPQKLISESAAATEMAKEKVALAKRLKKRDAGMSGKKGNGDNGGKKSKKTENVLSFHDVFN